MMSNRAKLTLGLATDDLQAGIQSREGTQQTSRGGEVGR